jgi:magnesium transporter
VTTVIRALAVGEIGPRDVLKVTGKEVVTSVALGLTMGVLMFGRGVLQGGTDVDPVRLGLLLAITVLILAVWAAVVAAILPLLLTRLRVDPAVVSAPLITSIIDATGLVVYFTAARLLVLN